MIVSSKYFHTADIERKYEVVNLYKKKQYVLHFDAPEGLRRHSTRYGIKHGNKISWYFDREECYNAANCLLLARDDRFQIVTEHVFRETSSKPVIYPFSPLFERNDRDFLYPKHKDLIDKIDTIDELPF